MLPSPATVAPTIEVTFATVAPAIAVVRRSRCVGD
jgi:hypothetical protein